MIFQNFNSKKKREQVIADLQSKGMDAELENILNAEAELEAITQKAIDAGEYQAFKPMLPSSEEEEGEAKFEAFEGFSMNKLMERVYNRLMNQ